MSASGLELVRQEIENGIHLLKCQKCGCMREALDNLAVSLSEDKTGVGDALAASLETWNGLMRPVEYACLGCEYCFAASALNALAVALPSAEHAPLACDFKSRDDDRHMVVGEYAVVDKAGHVAVSTLASVALSDALAARKPQGLAIVGKTETENIGIDKVVKNIIANPAIQYLIVAGKDPDGHQSGKTLLALAENGINSERRVIGSPGKRPILRNVSFDQVQAFREQVLVIDLIGCEDQAEIIARVESLSPKAPEPCG